MADAHQPRETKTLQFARFITRNRFPVAMALIISTTFFAYPIFTTIVNAFGLELAGPQVRINTSARALFSVGARTWNVQVQGSPSRSRMTPTRHQRGVTRSTPGAPR